MHIFPIDRPKLQCIFRIPTTVSIGAVVPIKHTLTDVCLKNNYIIFFEKKVSWRTPRLESSEIHTFLENWSGVTPVWLSFQWWWANWLHRWQPLRRDLPGSRICSSIGRIQHVCLSVEWNTIDPNHNVPPITVCPRKKNYFSNRGIRHEIIGKIIKTCLEILRGTQEPL